MTPKVLTDPEARARARWIRDWQWAVAERIAATDPLWICWWNKNRHHDEATAPSDLLICGLIDGSELAQWLNSHPDWWVIGEWDADRYAAPVSITEAGRAALANRSAFDSEPVNGGLVEPGWTCSPAEPVGVRS